MIAVQQNSERQLRHLAAQRQLYAYAKKIFGWQVLLSGPIAVVSAFLVLAFPPLKGAAATWGILVTLADLLWLTPWQRRVKDEAARVQELFDCEVLELSWNDLKAGNRPEAELVKEQSDRYKSWEAKMPPLTDWYAPAVSDLPLHIGRIACQRSNCWWDSKQRRRYARWVVAIVASIFLVVLLLSIGQGFTIEDFVLKIAAPLSPALLLGLRQYTEQMDAANRLDKVKAHSEQLWKDAISEKPELEITARARNLQDEILENRRKGPLVFDAIFKRIRPHYEAQMNFGVDELVAEAKQKLGLD